MCVVVEKEGGKLYKVSNTRRLFRYLEERNKLPVWPGDLDLRKRDGGLLMRRDWQGQMLDTQIDRSGRGGTVAPAINPKTVFYPPVYPRDESTALVKTTGEEVRIDKQTVITRTKIVNDYASLFHDLRYKHKICLINDKFKYLVSILHFLASSCFFRIVGHFLYLLNLNSIFFIQIQKPIFFLTTVII